MKKGFGIIEVLVSMSVMALVIVTLISLASATFLSWDNAKNKTIAQGILQDTIESIHNKRDVNVLGDLSTVAWDKGIGNGGLSIDIGGTFTETSSGSGIFTAKKTVNNKEFTTEVAISYPNGDPLLDLPAGAASGSIKRFTVTVKWSERPRGIGDIGARDIKSITYITDWRSKY